MSKHDAKTSVEEAPKMEPSQVEQGQMEPAGIRSRKIIAMPQFIPSADWVNQNVVAKGKGTKVTVGRLYGIVTGTKEKLNKLPSGEEKTSIALLGMFEAVNLHDGEVSNANVAYLPDTVGETMKAMFAADPDLKTVQIDMDVALEATGKMIPYTWAITNYVKDESANPLAALRNNRVTPALTGPAKPAQLAAPK